jgi:hypothetical protein
MMDVDQAAQAIRDEEMLAEIEDFIEGFNQPTYRGMRSMGSGWLRGPARLRRPRRSFQHAMADHRRGETEGPLGTQGVRPLGVPPSAVARPIAWCAERSGIQG